MDTHFDINENDMEMFSFLDYSTYPRPRLNTITWGDENTICYQIEVHGICVVRRQDNNMINGTKLLNITGMSRGKRDGILKNEKDRIVFKVGSLNLKGVWIPFDRAKILAKKYQIYNELYPLFAQDPSQFLYQSPFYIPFSWDDMILDNYNI